MALGDREDRDGESMMDGKAHSPRAGRWECGNHEDPPVLLNSLEIIAHLKKGCTLGDIVFVCNAHGEEEA